MKIVFLTSHYPPDLGAGAFRSVALVQALSRKLTLEDEIHVVTTYPHRYASHEVTAMGNEGSFENVYIHRIQLTNHQNGMADQVRAFTGFFCKALRYCYKIKPTFIVGTTSRLGSGILTWFASILVGCRYFIDVRDIFSETLEDVISLKRRWLGRPLGMIFSSIEKFIFLRASGINVVSKGFPDYYLKQGLDVSEWSFFPNGVDREFINYNSMPIKKELGPKTVLYAGNIGDGQGLEIILPYVAEQVDGDFKFRIIGDGGTRNLLENKIIELGIDNIELLAPVGREQLCRYYDQADILFLHLNDLPAFDRVLPSKIFEYGALGKPIVAGISGYSAKFIKDNLPQASVFSPGNIDDCLLSLQRAEQCDVRSSDVERFVDEFSREVIMENMANHIVSKVPDNA